MGQQRERGVCITEKGLALLEEARGKRTNQYGKSWTYKDLAIAADISERTLRSFRKGEPKDKATVLAICNSLELDFKEVVSLESTVGGKSSILEVEIEISPLCLDDVVSSIRDQIYEDIQQLHGKIPLWGVDYWVSLNKMSVDVNVLEEVSSSRRIELSDLWDDFQKHRGHRGLDRIGLSRRIKRVPGFSLLEGESKVMVLGKPGSGKTTFLQQVVIASNQGKFRPDCIPVLIRLREFSSDGLDYNFCIETYLRDLWSCTQDVVKEVLKNGRILMLLDGLDELSGNSGEAIEEEIEKFARRYPRIKLVLSSRIVSQKARILRFCYVEIADFSEPQIEDFVTNWFVAVLGDAGYESASGFLEKLYLDENNSVRELMVTPVILGLACTVYRYNHKFYSSRARLYQEGLDLLLEQWGLSKDDTRSDLYLSLKLKQKLDLLSHLAKNKFDQPQYLLFAQEELVLEISRFLALDFDESLQVLFSLSRNHGLLIERVRGTWTFSHLSFQEFLVARYLVEQAGKNELDWGEVSQYVVQLRWSSGRPMLGNRWPEVLTHVASLLDDSTPFLSSLSLSINSFAADSSLVNWFSWTELALKDSKVSVPIVVQRAVALEISCSLSPDVVNNMGLAECGNLLSSLLNKLGFSGFSQKILESFESLGGARFRPTVRVIDTSFELVELLLESQLFPSLDFDRLSIELEALRERKSVVEKIPNPIDKLLYEYVDDILKVWSCFFLLDDLWTEIFRKESELLDYLEANIILLDCKRVSNSISVDEWLKIEESMLLLPPQ